MKAGFILCRQLAASAFTCFLHGSLIAICGAVLITTGGLSFEERLLSVSKIRKNFSASMAMTSTVSSNRIVKFNHPPQSNLRAMVAHPVALIKSKRSPKFSCSVTWPSRGRYIEVTTHTRWPPC